MKLGVEVSWSAAVHNYAAAKKPSWSRGACARSDSSDEKEFEHSLVLFLFEVWGQTIIAICFAE